MEPQNNKLTKVSAGILSVVAITGVAFYLSKNETASNTATAPTIEMAVTKTEPTMQMPHTTMDNSSSSMPMAMMHTLYKNGTYTADGMYSAPSGQETVKVSLTVSNDVVTSATFSGNPKKDDSQEFQNKFSKGFSVLVLGKNIDAINLHVVNGASLTPKGFMEAVEKIKVEAKA